MRPLSPAELLGAWENAYSLSPIRASLALLAAASPDMAPEQLAQLPIGQRDARLLTLREWSFGSEVVSTCACPACESSLEVTFDLSDVRSAPVPEPAPLLRLVAGEYELHLRLPNSLDALATIAAADAEHARRLLLERCIVSVEQHGEPVAASALPEAVGDQVESAMAEADPDGDIQLSMVCPDCNHVWSATFDIGSFFWSELSSWAWRLLYDVHTLASAYGWHETEILALSPWRRQFYLEAVGL